MYRIQKKTIKTQNLGENIISMGLTNDVYSFHTKYNYRGRLLINRLISMHNTYFNRMWKMSIVSGAMYFCFGRNVARVTYFQWSLVGWRVNVMPAFLGILKASNQLK